MWFKDMRYHCDYTVAMHMLTGTELIVLNKFTRARSMKTFGRLSLINIRIKYLTFKKAIQVLDENIAKNSKLQT